MKVRITLTKKEIHDLVKSTLPNSENLVMDEEVYTTLYSDVDFHFIDKKEYAINKLKEQDEEEDGTGP